MINTRTRRTIVLLAALAIATTPVGLTAQTRSGLGVGIMVGEPTGVSLISWLGGGNALDFVGAWSFQGDGSFYLHADYQFHTFVESPMSLFAGLGGFALLQDNPVIGFRVPLGISFIFQQVPMDLFLEVAPGMNLAPATDFFIGGGLGFRFYL